MERERPYLRAGGRPHGCWYYLRYFFLFVSLIQFLIILGLVLFMVYGNVHVSTESDLQATKRLADDLYRRVVELTATSGNLSKDLNVTTRAKDAIMQMLLGARREQDRINSSFRQCQSERLIYINNLRYMAAIILSEQQCQDQLKELNKSCNTLMAELRQKANLLELELTKKNNLFTTDKQNLEKDKRMKEERLGECVKLQEQQQLERQLAEQRLQKVQDMCLQFDKETFATEVQNLWRDSIISRALGNLNYNFYNPLGLDLATIHRTCEQLPAIVASKVEELVRSLRLRIEHVARENTELQRQKAEVEQALKAAQAAGEKAEKEAQGREAKLQAESTRQTQLALEEKAALRKERDGLAKELEQKKREAEQLKVQWDVSNTALDTCIKAKSQVVLPPRPPGPSSNIQPIDKASLEEFKKKILESHGSSVGSVIVVPSNG
ncbi:plasmalemma vesicle-associated protein [Lepus europaeus]|uniref:plasmalemma vesicle-associated protein n=1 Tax=Lepus europaeus TaxID=9983 RepID=UPI002B480B81|nr:plasmalemma vesicle-associated protein [Lepus europaeus]